ncbi:MAG: hypothetical protein ACYTF7_00465 [Planctomycetota bacterium]|jgi:hypothetical protein
MRLSRTRLLAFASAVLVPVLGGCVSSAPSYVTFYSPTNQNSQVATLGAGDSLGMSVRSNDVILAAKLRGDGHTPALANVPDDQD